MNGWNDEPDRRLNAGGRTRKRRVIVWWMVVPMLVALALAATACKDSPEWGSGGRGFESRRPDFAAGGWPDGRYERGGSCSRGPFFSHRCAVWCASRRFSACR